MKASQQALCLAWLIGFLPGLFAASSPPLPEYKVGETAALDIVAPLHLIVIDHQRTERLRQQEAQLNPAIFRFYPEAAEEAEAAFHAAFASAREKFLDALEASYAQRTVNEVAVTYPRFQRLVASFQRQFAMFPVSTNLATTWARGGSDESLQTDYLAPLRESMAHRICPEALPSEAIHGVRPARLLSIKGRASEIDLGLVEQQGTEFWPTNLYTLARAREELQSRFPAQDREMAGFVASFLKENCVFDIDLTAQSREKRTEGIWAADEYQPGQLIVKRGDLIDLRTKAVLDQLRERAAGEQARKTIVKEEQETRATVAQLHAETARAEASAHLTAEQNRWLLRGIGASLLACVFVFWRLVRWKRSHSLLPARIHNHEVAGTVVSCPSCSGAIVLPLELRGPAPIAAPALPAELPAATGAAPPDSDYAHWRERALAAESRAQEMGQTLRGALVPHLARLLMSKLVRALVGQRRKLVETQHRAEQELAELEQRLLSVHAPLEERLKAYEERIAELERDLTAKGQENGELIKATIAMARKRLELERSKDRLAWN